MKKLYILLISFVGGVVIIVGAMGWWMFFQSRPQSAHVPTPQQSQSETPAQQKQWRVVQTFTGPSKLKSFYTEEELNSGDTNYETPETGVFEITGDRVRITFENEFNDLAPKCLYSGPTIMLYPEGESDKYTTEISDDDCNGLVSKEYGTAFDVPKGRYYFKVFSVYDWKITVEEYK